MNTCSGKVGRVNRGLGTAKRSEIAIGLFPNYHRRVLGRAGGRRICRCVSTFLSTGYQSWKSTFVLSEPGCSRGKGGILYRVNNMGSRVGVSVCIGGLTTNRILSVYRSGGRYTILLLSNGIRFRINRVGRVYRERGPFRGGPCTIRFSEKATTHVATVRPTRILIRRASGRGS